MPRRRATRHSTPTGSHYLNVDSTAFLQLLESRVFKDFPRLRLVISHGGGNVPYQAARYRAIGIMNKWEPFEEFVKRLYFDTTVYSQDAMEMLIKVVGVDNILFASEMLGGVTTIDPTTGRFFDDNKPCLDAIALADRRGPTKDLRRERQEGVSPSAADPRPAGRADRPRCGRDSSHLTDTGVAQRVGHDARGSEDRTINHGAS